LQSSRVRVNGETEKDAKRMVEPDEMLAVMAKADQRVPPSGIAILHEDRDVIVILKSHGLLTVAYRARARGHRPGVSQHLSRQPRRRSRPRCSPPRSRDLGCIGLRQNFFAREQLKAQFMVHSVERVYVAVIEGVIDPPEGTIESNLFEQKDLRMVSVDAHPDAKHAITHYRTIGGTRSYAVLEVTLETGRKNQIRAHLSEAGYPVAGDTMYGARTNPLGRLGLHAKYLGFDHPTSGKHLVFTAALPKEFRAMVSL